MADTHAPARPPGVPDLPIRTRFGLLAWPMAMVLLSSVLFLAFIRLHFVGDSLPLIVALSAAYVVLAALWVMDRRRQIARTVHEAWWQVEMTRTEGGLTFRWTPHRMADLMPRLSPVLLIGLIPTIVAASQLPRLLERGWPAAGVAFLVCFIGIGLPSLMLLRFALFARQDPADRAAVEFHNGRVGLTAPFARRAWRLTPWPRRWLRWAHADLPAASLAGIRFDAASVTVTRRSRVGMGCVIRIPTPDTGQRRAIADWAARHNVPVAGDIDPRG